MTPISKSVALHGALLALSGILAFRTWTKGEDTAPKHGETDLWPGAPEQVQEVRFESKVGTLRLEPREDSHGKYYIGTVKKNPEPPQPKKPEDQAKASSTPPPPPPSTEPKITHFIATKDGDELMATIAPLRALRVLGKPTGAQKTDFGLDQEEGKLFVRMSGKERELIFGGPTPGATDRYATDQGTGNAYVISGNILRDLTNADQRLTDHRMHSWEDATAKRVKITVGTATRELIRSTDKKDAWTKPAAPAEKDETATNWMSKVDRLRVTSFEGEKLDPPPAQADVIVKLDYYDEHKPIGFLELVRRPGTGDKPEYVARTENTRWYASVIRSAAEQIDQDVKSVLTP